jgi:2'-5' RNA ligase
MTSAVIVRARLPAGLERLRRASVLDAASGVPAHLTMLYPFVERAGLTAAVRQALAAVARFHRPFAYELRGAASWPDTIYVAVEPKDPFVQLQRDLQSEFPAYPIYGSEGTFRFVPHVTIAEGTLDDEAAVRVDPAWGSLPCPARAKAIEVIATGPDARWRLVWRMPLGPAGGARPRTIDRMRP